MRQDACIDCQRCEQVCDMGIPVWRQGKKHGHITGLEDCMGCGRCVLACPTDALEFRDIRNHFMPRLRMNASYLLKRPGPPPLSPRVEVPTQPLTKRRKNWHEAHRVLSLGEAMKQAGRCLDCGVPGCQNACPLHNSIPEWLEALARGDIPEAATICHTTSNLPEICGTVCPSHRLCEGACTLNATGEPVIIGALERMLNEQALRQGWKLRNRSKPAQDKTAAIIGAGPAGLACADEINKAGFEVTIFDRQPQIGGLMAYGIPPFKLDKALLQRRQTLLEQAGIRLNLGVTVDTDMLLQIVDQHDVVFLATGAQRPRLHGLSGQPLTGVIDGLGFLSALLTTIQDPDSTHADIAGSCVLVLGGGNTAIDCARSAVRLGAIRVTVAYRHGQQQMRAAAKEIAVARDEGVGFIFHQQPRRLIGTDYLQGVAFEANDGEQENIYACDIAIIAFGQQADNQFCDKLGVRRNPHGFIITDDNGQTHHPKIFAGGDNSHGPDLVVTAIAAGRRAAQGMILVTQGTG